MISRTERRWIIWFAVILLVVTTLPYLIGFQRQGADWRFSGFVFGVEDGNSYIAKMLRAANGEWLFRTPYTTVPQRGFLAFLPYLLLGKLTAPPGQHDQLVVLFHLFRWAAVILMALATYNFLALFIQDIRWRRFGTALAMLGGGFGWLSVIGLSNLWGARMPLEFYSPESFGFLSLFGLPHLALARALLLWGLIRFLAAKTIRQAVIPGLLWLLLGFVQPLTVVTGWAILGAYLATSAVDRYFQQKKRQSLNTNQASYNDPPTRPQSWQAWLQQFRIAIVIGLISSPMVIYTFAAFLLDPYLKGWAQQNIILSPPPGDYLFAYGAVLPLVILGIRWLSLRRFDRANLLIGWLVIFPFLAYFPYNLQRRLPDGIWVALVVLGMIGVVSLGSRWQRPVIAWLALTFIPALFLLSGAVMTAANPSSPLFHSVPVVKAFEYLSGHAEKDSATLASFLTSNQLPAWAPLRVVIGHGPESVGIKEIQPEVEAFYKPTMTDEDRLALLRSLGIRYVFYGPEERKLGERSPGESPFLKLIYAEQGVQIFQFQPE